MVAPAKYKWWNVPGIPPVSYTHLDVYKRQQLAKQGVTIIGIDYKDESPKAIKWLKDLGNPYSLVLKDEKGSFALDLGVYGAPETFIVDGKGVIHYRLAGDVNERVWNETLKPIYDKLAEKP